MSSLIPPLPLESMAPRITIKFNDQARLTQGFRQGLLVLFPESTHQFTRWLLVHEPSGGLLATFWLDDLRLGRAILRIASQFDWRGSDAKLIARETRKAWADLYKEFQLDKTGSEIAQEQCDRSKKFRKMMRRVRS